MRQKSKPEIYPHIDHLSNLLIHRQRSVEHYCGKQSVNRFISLYIISIYLTSIDSWITFKFIYVSKSILKFFNQKNVFRPSSDLSSNTSIHSHRSNIDIQLRQSDLNSSGNI
jgi:hypothetical protein